MPVIQVDHLTKDYGHGRGVFDVTLQVERGEVYGFLGPNGAGKTTTIRHVVGFSRPQRGKITVNGLDSWQHASEIQRDLGYLPGEIALPDSMSGTQFIRMMAELRHLKSMDYTHYLIDKFRLDPAGSLKRMSLGMKRKLAIVVAFMHDPAVLVLDEPTSGLDPAMQHEFIQFIREEKARGKTILLSSHIFSEIDATCDRISVIKDGRIISTFIADELRMKQEKNYVVEFGMLDEFERFSRASAAFAALRVSSLDSVRLRAAVAVDNARINEFIAWISAYELKDFTEIPFSLEQYFMKFYDRNLPV